MRLQVPVKFLKYFDNYFTFNIDSLLTTDFIVKVTRKHT